MKKYFKIFTIVLLSYFGFGSRIYAQLMTNFGDTISISNGSSIYINGGLNLNENATHFPYIQNKGTLDISGDFTKSTHAIYVGGKDSVILSGKDSQLFPGFSYGILSIDSGNIKNLAGKAYIRGQLLLNKGYIHTKNDTIELDSLATMKEDSLNYVTGNMTITRNLFKGKNNLNGNIGLELQASNFDPAMTTIFRKTGPDATQNAFCSHGIARYFDIKPTGTFSAKFVFHYYPVELNGLSKSKLAYYGSSDYKDNWFGVGFVSRDAVNSTVTQTIVNPRLRITLGDEFNPIVDPVKISKDITICQGDEVPIGGDSTDGHNYSWESIPTGYHSTTLSDTVKPDITTLYILTIRGQSSSCINKDTIKINVTPLPSVGFKVVQLTCSNFVFTANDTSQVSYSWNFGDGTIETGPKANHKFAKDSTYLIKLMVTNTNGCTGEHDTLFNYKTPQFDYVIFPNPASETANARFTLCESAKVSIAVYDELGRHLETITDGELAEGFYNFPINFGKYNWQNAMYFVRTVINNKSVVNKVVRVK